MIFMVKAINDKIKISLFTLILQSILDIKMHFFF